MIDDVFGLLLNFLLPFRLSRWGEWGMNVTHFVNAFDVSHKADNGFWSYFDANAIYLASSKSSIKDNNGIIRISRRERFSLAVKSENIYCSDDSLLRLEFMDKFSRYFMKIIITRVLLNK